MNFKTFLENESRNGIYLTLMYKSGRNEILGPFSMKEATEEAKRILEEKRQRNPLYQALIHISSSEWTNGVPQSSRSKDIYWNARKGELNIPGMATDDTFITRKQ